MPHPDKTTLGISERTREKLRKIQDVDDSWNNLIEELIDFWIKGHKEIKKLNERVLLLESNDKIIKKLALDPETRDKLIKILDSEANTNK